MAMLSCLRAELDLGNPPPDDPVPAQRLVRTAILYRGRHESMVGNHILDLLERATSKERGAFFISPDNQSAVVYWLEGICTAGVAEDTLLVAHKLLKAIGEQRV